MSRRRGGREYKLRKLLATALGNSAQKRGNNTKLRINTLKSQTVINHKSMASPVICVVSNILFTRPVVLLDGITSSFIRIVGSWFPKTNQIDSSSETGSDASTLIPETPEVITID